MAEQADPVAPYNGCYQCAIVGDHVQCSNPESQDDQIVIPVEDILCILPDGGNHAFKYTMLFLRGDTRSPDAELGLESIYLKSAPRTLLSSHPLIATPSHLGHPSNKHMKLHIIISTGSGIGMAKLLFSRVLQPLLTYIGVTKYEMHETRSAQTITELCHSLFIPQASAGVQQTIVLLSGDGGLCDIIDSFHNTPKDIRIMPNIALIPAGTGNAMASSTGLLAYPKTALMALLHGKPFAVPVFAATFSHGASYIHGGRTESPAAIEPSCLKIYGSVVASWGMHAALVADSDTLEYRKFGADRFKMAAKELLFPSDGSEAHKYSGTITLIRRDVQRNIEHEEVLSRKEHMYVLATLVSNLEKDFMISPQSTLLDGCLRMIHFGPVSPQRAMEVMSSAYQGGRHVLDDDVMYTEIERFRIQFHEVDERWRRVCIDGRVVAVTEGGWMEVRKEKRRLLNLLLPDLQNA